MRITITTMLVVGLLGLSINATAAERLPDRGLTQDTIRQQFGAPKRQVAPVGTPPISRWIYDDFTIYFEGNISIHAVSHRRTLTTPPASAVTPSPAPATIQVVDELPPIEEATPPAAVAEPEPAAPEPPAENTFRFDPVTGRIIEIGPDGRPVQSPTAQPAPAPVRQAPAPIESERAPIPAPAPAPAPAPEPAPEVAPKAAPAPAEPAPAAAPAAPEEQPASGRFRFDPATGRIVMDEPAATSEPAPAKASEPAPAAPQAPASNDNAEPGPEPKSEPKSEPAGSGEGAFRLQW
jgi:hypothetical protein